MPIFHIVVDTKPTRHPSVYFVILQHTYAMYNTDVPVCIALCNIRKFAIRQTLRHW